MCDQNIYLLGFNNGVYDTESKQFREGHPTDYITKSVGYDFPKAPTNYINDIESYFNKILPNENIKSILYKCLQTV